MMDIGVSGIPFLIDRTFGHYEIGTKAASKWLFYNKVIIPLGLITGLALAILFSPYAAFAATPVIAYGIHGWVRAISLKSYCEIAAANANMLFDCMESCKQLETIDINIRNTNNPNNFKEHIANMTRSLGFIENYYRINQLVNPYELRELLSALEKCNSCFLTIYREVDNDFKHTDPIPFSDCDYDIITAKELISREVSKIKMFIDSMIGIISDNLCEFLHDNKILAITAEVREEMNTRQRAMKDRQASTSSSVTPGDDWDFNLVLKAIEESGK